MRGPILFCLEAVDNPDANLLDISVPRESTPTSRFHPHLLGGCQVIEISGYASPPEETWKDNLYMDTLNLPSSQEKRQVVLKAIPYFAWANRQAGQMLIWLPESTD